MRTPTRFLLLAATAVMVTSAPVLAQNVATANLTVNATVAATAKLTLSAASISFADADPDTTSVITATGGALTVDAKAKTGRTSNVTLTVQAGGPLTSGSDTIAATAITWTATGTGFQNGTMDTAAQALGSFTGPGNNSGTQTYQLANSWAYATGNYSMTVTYTLTAP